MKDSVDDCCCQTKNNKEILPSDTSIQERARLLYRGEALAPMVRASTTPLRILALKYGADFVYTEELIDRAVSGSKRIENERLGTIDYVKDASGMGKKQLRKMKAAGGPPILLRIDPSIEQGRLVCQLGTGEVNYALEAALRVHKDVSSIDINMGCPKKFSVSGGMGSALLSDPERASNIVRTLRNNLPIPVSAKIRLLKDTSSTLDFCQSLIHAGVNAIAIHARRVGDASTESADWDTLKEVVQLLKSKEPSLPVLLNGDFYTRQEWMDFQDETRADGVLLARPALYNTSIFKKPPSLQSSVNSPTFGYDSPLLLSKTAVVQDYLQEAIRYRYHYKNVKYVVCEMINNRRSPISRLQHLPITLDGNQRISSVCKCHSLQDMCKEFFVTLPNTEMNGAQQQQQQAGEHIYKDSYFLNKKETVLSSADTKSNEAMESPLKRPRIQEQRS